MDPDLDTELRRLESSLKIAQQLQQAIWTPENGQESSPGDGPSSVPGPPPQVRPRLIWKIARLSGKSILWIFYTVMVYAALLGLNYYDLFDPCCLKFSYRRTCKVDFYFSEGLLRYTEYAEDSFCLVPGINFHEEEKGWNLDVECK